MSKLKEDKNIERYLGSVETGLAMNEGEVQRALHEKTSTLLTHVEEATVHLYEADREEARLLQAALDELRVQFALGRMEGAEVLAPIEKRLKNGILHLKNALEDLKDLPEEEKDALKRNLHKGWRRLDLEITLLYLRLGLARDAGSAKFAAAKEEIADDLKIIARSARENTEEVTDHFTSWVKKVEKKVSRRGHRILQSMDDYFQRW